MLYNKDYLQKKQEIFNNFIDNDGLVLNYREWKTKKAGKVIIHKKWDDHGDAAWRTGLMAVALILEGDDASAKILLQTLLTKCWRDGQPIRHPQAYQNPLSRDQFIPQMLACLLSFTCSNNKELQALAKTLFNKFLMRIKANNLQLSTHKAGYLPITLQHLTNHVAKTIGLPGFNPSVKQEFDNIRARDNGQLRARVKQNIHDSLRNFKISGKVVLGRIWNPIKWKHEEISVSYSIGIPSRLIGGLAATIADHLVVGNLYKLLGGFAKIIDEGRTRVDRQSAKAWFKAALRKNISDELYERIRIQKTFRAGGLSKTITIGISRGDSNNLAGKIAASIANELLGLKLPETSFKLIDFIDAISAPNTLHSLYGLYTNMTSQRVKESGDEVNEYYQVHLMFCQLLTIYELDKSAFKTAAGKFNLGQALKNLQQVTSRHKMALIETLFVAQTKYEDHSLKISFENKYIKHWDSKLEHTDYAWQQDIFSQRRDAKEFAAMILEARKHDDIMRNRMDYDSPNYPKIKFHPSLAYIFMKSCYARLFEYHPGANLQPGMLLKINERITSENGQYFLIYQNDGNLVLYTQGAAYGYWSSATAGTSPAGFAIMQGDGNFVLSKPGAAYGYWATNTEGNEGAYLELHNNGDLAVYSKHGVRLWHSNTALLAARALARELSTNISSSAASSSLKTLGMYANKNSIKVIKAALTNLSDDKNIEHPQIMARL